MKDAHGAGAARCTLVEGGPRWSVLALRVGGVCLERFKRLPVLDHRDRSSSHFGAGTQEAELGVLVKLHDHWPHRQERREPLPHAPEGIDVHADQEEHERLLDVGHGSNRDVLCHDFSLCWLFNPCPASTTTSTAWFTCVAAPV